MGSHDASPEPIDQIKRTVLNFKVKLLIWYSKRPAVVLAGVVLVVLVLFLSRNVRITIVTSASGDHVITPQSKNQHNNYRKQRNTKLRKLFDPESPVLLDLTGIRDPNPPDLEEYKKKLFKENQFNTYISDRTPLNRLHDDLRSTRCKARRSSYVPVSEMPSLSIVFIFVDECLSVLLRSIVSIIITTPPELLHDIVLVDDASEKLEVGKRLEEELAIFGDLTKLVRHEARSGLMVARTTGLFKRQLLCRVFRTICVRFCIFVC